MMKAGRRSSYFGINDLWVCLRLHYTEPLEQESTLHILPHWNWEGREGEESLVFVYTNYNSAELL
jgi:beta-galactosidase